MFVVQFRTKRSDPGQRRSKKTSHIYLSVQGGFWLALIFWGFYIPGVGKVPLQCSEKDNENGLAASHYDLVYGMEGRGKPTMSTYNVHVCIWILFIGAIEICVHDSSHVGMTSRVHAAHPVHSSVNIHSQLTLATSYHTLTQNMAQKSWDEAFLKLCLPPALPAHSAEM